MACVLRYHALGLSCAQRHCLKATDFKLWALPDDTESRHLGTMIRPFSAHRPWQDVVTRMPEPFADFGLPDESAKMA